MAAKKFPKHVSVREVERVQTGVRLEKRLLKVLKGLAEYLDLSLGDLLEGIALHALENKPPFKRVTLEKVSQLRRVYGLDLVASDSHRLRDQGDAETQR
jgi:predicted DNA-binding ribbon-helix-helix protein